MLPLVDSGSSRCRERTASTLDTIASVGIRFGVTECFSCRLTTTFHLTLMMTSTQVVETSVTTTDNSPSQDYTHPDYQTTLLHVTPGFKPFTVRQLKAIPWDTLATERSISRD